MGKKTKQPTLVRTPFGSYVLKKDEMPEPAKTRNKRVADVFRELACKACQKNELRDLVYKLLDTLPKDLVAEYAQEKLELMTYDSAMEQAADGAEVAREGYHDR